MLPGFVEMLPGFVEMLPARAVEVSMTVNNVVQMSDRIRFIVFSPGNFSIGLPGWVGSS